jgi:hypothetical protein
MARVCGEQGLKKLITSFIKGTFSRKCFTCECPFKKERITVQNTVADKKKLNIHNEKFNVGICNP